MTRTLKLTLQYIGTGYRGWQIQPGIPTIQGAVEEALERIVGEPVSVAGSGRTDAGVHARGQVASFRTGCLRRPEVIQRAANARLPWDIRIVAMEEEAGGFHARECAKLREYRYQVWTGEVLPPFLHDYAAHCRASLDPSSFARAARTLLGRHDFSAFASSGSSSVDPVRAVTASELLSEGELWTYRIEADGFLYKMVRNIAGTLLEIARGRWPVEMMEELLRSRDRTLAGPPLPAHGLFLERVTY